MQKYQRIRDLREDADLTQKQVGEAINVPQRTYAYYESGQRMVPPQVLCALADFYGVSVDYILGRTDIEKDSFTRAFFYLFSSIRSLSSALPAPALKRSRKS